MAKLPHWKLLVAGLVSSQITCFTTGFYMSSFNEPIDILQQFVNYSHSVYNGGYIYDDSAMTGIWSVVVCMFLLGQIFGSFFVPFFGDRFGRKWSMMVYVNIGALVGIVLLVIAKPTKLFEFLILGRFIAGFFSGIGGGLLAVYLSECSPDEHRGLLGMMQNAFISVSTFIGAILSVQEVMGTVKLWPYLLGLPIILILLQMVISPLFPETPKYIYLQKQDKLAAMKSLAFYHGKSVNYEDIFAELDREADAEKDVKRVSFVQIFKDRNLRWSAVLSFSVMSASILTGIFAIFSYSTIIFEAAHVSKSISQWTTVIMSAMNVVGALLSAPMNQFVGRRPLILMGVIGTMICNIVFLVTNQIYDTYDVNGLQYVSLVAMVAHVTWYNMTIGAIGWFYSSEVSPQQARASCATMAFLANAFFAFVQVILLPVLLRAIGSYVFLIFIIPNIFLGLFLWKYAPETKGKPIDEILKIWWKDDGEIENGKVDTKGPE